MVLVAMPIDFTREAIESPRVPLAGGDFGDAEDLGDFGPGELLQITEHENFAIGFRKFGEPLHHARLHFGFDQPAVGRSHRRRQVRSQMNGRLIGPLRERSLFANHTSTRRFDVSLVEANQMFPRQAAQPRIKGHRSLAKIVGEFERGLGESLLDDIRRVEPREQTAIEAYRDHPPQSIAIAVEEFSSRKIVAVQRLRQ